MNNKLRISIAQINPIVGDICGNTQKIINYALRARDKQRAELVVFPELAIVGYPPEDLLFRQELFKQVNKACHKICKQVKNIYIILGVPQKFKSHSTNSAIVIYNGKIMASYHKQFLPNWGVFDEKRYFHTGKAPNTITIKGIKIGLLICRDLWEKQPIHNLKTQGAKLIIALNASPFAMHKAKLREQILYKRAKINTLPIIYINLVGAQDELVFDGGSYVINSKGQVVMQAPFFQTTLIPITFKTVAGKLIPNTKPKIPAKAQPIALVYQALVLGLSDYFYKNGTFTRVILGVSGGIDSALSLAIAVDALGKNQVQAFYLPSRYSSKLSTTITAKLTKNLGVKVTTLSIEPVCQSLLDLLGKEFSKCNITCQNIQARCRGIILMAYANRHNALVLATGNRSEMATGYTTLYGDMVGGFSVLKDVPKTLVYKLAKYRNTISSVIPLAALTRKPTAELALDQKDTDTLPPYPLLDKIIKQYVEEGKSITQIVTKKLKRATVKHVINMIKNSEYKRRQGAPGIKITTCALTRERRYPIINKANF